MFKDFWLPLIVTLLVVGSILAGAVYLGQRGQRSWDDAWSQMVSDPRVITVIVRKDSGEIETLKSKGFVVVEISEYYVLFKKAEESKGLWEAK